MTNTQPTHGPVFDNPGGPVLTILFYVDDKTVFEEDFQLTRLKSILEGDAKAVVRLVNRSIKIDKTLLAEYHEVWFFLASLSGDPLSNAECRALRDWMDLGNGVLIAGDHANETETENEPDSGRFEGLGRPVGSRVPRARHMRVWDAKPGWSRQLGNVNTTETTAGRRKPSQELEQDATPQRLLLPTDAADDPHPIFRGTDDNIFDALPEHRHEGKVLAPSLPLTEDPLAIPAHVNEWWGSRSSPEIVARSIDWRRGDCFDIMAVWDGHAVRSVKNQDTDQWHVCGRIVADSSWHHYVDPNVDAIANDNKPAWAKIAAIYVNLAAWLAPPPIRRAYREAACAWVGNHRDYVLAGEDRPIGAAAFKLLAHKLPGAWFHELADDLLQQYGDVAATPAEFRDVLMGAYMRHFMSNGEQRPKLHRVSQPARPELLAEFLADLEDELRLKQERLDAFSSLVSSRR